MLSLRPFVNPGPGVCAHKIYIAPSVANNSNFFYSLPIFSLPMVVCTQWLCTRYQYLLQQVCIEGIVKQLVFKEIFRVARNGPRITL